MRGGQNLEVCEGCDFDLRSLIDIALEVGYTSPSHFAQVFRRVVGLKPTEFGGAVKVINMSDAAEKEVSDHYAGQRQVLINGINAFEPAVDQLHAAYKRQEFTDWPTIILATTVQTSAISLFKLLPLERRREPLDKRSIASIIRNLIDTHDSLDLLLNTATLEEFNLHRDILGLYLASRIAKVQSSIASDQASQFYPYGASTYWDKIRKSKLYDKSMDRLKRGESLFYTTRVQRVKKACGAHADFVIGVIADLSTYVHSVPPALWFSDIDELYADTGQQRPIVGVWLRVANFYLGRSFSMVLDIFPVANTTELKDFISRHQAVFAS